jgi:hypothetical protein
MTFLRLGHNRFLVSVALLLGVAGCAEQSNVVASVDGDPITRDELASYLAVKQSVRVNVTGAVSGGSVLAEVQDSLGFQGLEDLIRDRVIIHLAKQRGVYPEKVDIENEIAYQKGRDSTVLPGLFQSGWDVNAVRQQLLLQLCAERIVTKGIVVTPADVDAYIAANPTILMRPASIRAYWILVGDASKEEAVDRELLSGQPFPSVATRYSQAEGAASSQGLFPEESLSQLPPKLQTILKSARESEVTPWIQTDHGLAKWYIDQIVPAMSVPADDSMRESIRRLIAMQRGSKLVDFDQLVRSALINCHVEFSVPGYESLWNDEVSNLAHGQTSILALPRPIGD